MYYLYDDDAAVICGEYSTEQEAQEQLDYLLSVNPELDMYITQDESLR